MSVAVVIGLGSDMGRELASLMAKRDELEQARRLDQAA